MRLRRELKAVGVGDGKWVLECTMPNADDSGQMCRACGSFDHAREHCPIWPPGIGEALTSNPDSAEHKWRLKRSPELEGFPESEWGVPLFHEMNREQQEKFLTLLGRGS